MLLCLLLCVSKAHIGSCILTACGFRLQIRALLTGGILGTIFSVIVHKLNLTTGIVPSLNIAAGLLGFIFLRGWTLLLKSFGIIAHEFTPQASLKVQHYLKAP